MKVIEFQWVSYVMDKGTRTRPGTLKSSLFLQSLRWWGFCRSPVALRKAPTWHGSLHVHVWLRARDQALSFNNERV
jgi:hypothetical protein